MKPRILSTHPLSEAKGGVYPSFPPLPSLPVMSVHYKPEGYFTKRLSWGLYPRNSYDAAESDPTDDVKTAAWGGLLHNGISAAEFHNAKGEPLGIMMLISDFNYPALTHNDLAVLTALRIALEPGLNDGTPVDDKLYDEAFNFLAKGKRKVYTSKLSGKTFEGKDVMTNQLCYELNEDIIRAAETLDINRAKSPKPSKIAPKRQLSPSKGSKMPINPSLPPDEEPRVKVEGSLTPNELAAEFNTTPQRIRKFLRNLYATADSLSHTHRQRWLWHPDYDGDELEILYAELSKAFNRKGN